MKAQEILQNTLLEAGGLRLQFHAFYWGKFELIEVIESKGYSFFAEATSPALERKLSFKGSQIFLHNNEVYPILLAKDLRVFFNNFVDYAKMRIFDARPSYTKLFSPAQMYVSDFSDPEDFEEVEAYLKIIEGMNAHFGNIFGIEKILGEEDGDKKRIELHLRDSKHTVILTKELFDIDILNALTGILSEHYNIKETLHLSIDTQMRMIILKLDSQALKEAHKMGLIV